MVDASTFVEGDERLDWNTFQAICYALYEKMERDRAE